MNGTGEVRDIEELEVSELQLVDALLQFKVLLRQLGLSHARISTLYLKTSRYTPCLRHSQIVHSAFDVSSTTMYQRKAASGGKGLQTLAKGVMDAPNPLIDSIVDRLV